MLLYRKQSVKHIVEYRHTFGLKQGHILSHNLYELDINDLTDVFKNVVVFSTYSFSLLTTLKLKLNIRIKNSGCLI